jgi:AP-4 complex subunit sigma-1
MTIEFVLLVNKQGQTRLAQYTNFKGINERSALEGEVVRKCLSRGEEQVIFQKK